MRKITFIVLFLLMAIQTNAQFDQYGRISIQEAKTNDGTSPGIISYGTSGDDFLYDGQYLNHYGFGFHGYQDGSTGYLEPRNAYISGHFGIDLFTGGTNRLRIHRTGGVSIGTAIRQPGYLLSVNGKIKAKEVKVSIVEWADFVFQTDYKLPRLQDVELFIAQNGHLRGVPSAKTVKEESVNLGEMDSKLLQKIEELTLYVIQQGKQITELQGENINLNKRLEQLEK
ncbi:hypothetical protein DSM03_11710 [Leeuwenhoekiella aestuarii]|uniref:hypothetical protein n=1 Tax=Leeuwenhoekiella aestuarii TaxID=2249426 RepID=UPI000FFEBE7D|nr:hypothetical protein [Leeuwenhoekiella aestuarii]RXG11373.1 hypothetical protein DSM03_11710 [Leeuwenhoekiella aestuarii]